VRAQARPFSDRGVQDSQAGWETMTFMTRTTEAALKAIEDVR
jgi:hypothetical protein